MAFARMKVALGLVLLVGLGWLGLALTHQRPVDLATFDPVLVARHETAAWKAYYAGEWFQLFTEVYQFSTDQYGFSKLDSLRLGYHAAQAAWRFRKLNAPERDQAAEAAIRPYFRIFSERSTKPFDYPKVARLEVVWWEMRRQKLPSEAWAEVIAEQSGLIFDHPKTDFLPAARLRVEAMCYRDDRRDSRMTDSDWNHVQDLLTQSAQSFLATVHSNPAAAKVIPSN